MTILCRLIRMTFYYAVLEVAEQQMRSYSSYVKKKKKNSNSQVRAEGVKILGVRSIKKQE